MLKRIVGLLSSPAKEEPLEEEQRIQLATCVLLLEIAHADGDFQQNEEDLVAALLEKHFNIEPGTAEELMELAQQARTESHDLHQFTRDINLNFDQSEKERIMESFWTLVYADGQLDRFEEALLRQLSGLIGLSHRQMIDAKLAVLERVKDQDS